MQVATGANRNDNIFLHDHIIICGDNPNTLSVIRSLGEYGILPIVIVEQEGHIPLVSRSKYVGRLIKSESIEAGIEILVDIAKKARTKPFVYTSDDNHESELDKNYERLKDLVYFFNAGESGRITELMNKKVLCDLALESGFVIPKGEVVERGVLPSTLSYPVYTKTLTPYSCGWKRDADIFYSPEELKSGYENMISEKFLLQEYITKKNEFEIHGFSINGGNNVYLTYYSLYYRLGKTTFGSYKYYQLLQDKELERKIKELIRKARYSGVFEVEFLIDQNDNLIFLEVNFRFALSNYACTFGNVNLPVLWAKSTLSGKIDVEDIHPSKSYFSFMDELSDFRKSVIRREVTFRQWIKDLKSVNCRMLYHKDDPWPCISFLLMTIGRFPIRKIHQIKLKRRLERI